MQCDCTSKNSGIIAKMEGPASVILHPGSETLGNGYFLHSPHRVVVASGILPHLDCLSQKP
jgi:hypothetical protein